MVIIPFFELVQLPKHKHYKEMQNIYILVKKKNDENGKKYLLVNAKNDPDKKLSTVRIF